MANWTRKGIPHKGWTCVSVIDVGEGADSVAFSLFKTGSLSKSVFNPEPRSVDLSYRDQDTPVVTYNADWQNNRKKARICYPFRCKI